MKPKQSEVPAVFDCEPELLQKENMLLQSFTKMLNSDPNPAELDKTPDGKASTLPISFIEMTLDELYFGQWGTENFSWNVIANEVVGKIDLVVTHPVTGRAIRRTGSASIQIMVDKGTNPLDVANKKANALDMGFPKLKAECLKNAAQSLGKIFGRDINRRKSDTFKPSLRPISKEAMEAAKERIASGEPGVIELVASRFIVTEDQLAELRNVSPLKRLA